MALRARSAWRWVYRELLTPIRRGEEDYAEDRRLAAAELLSTSPAIAELRESRVVDMLLAETREIAQLKVAAVRALEGKAVAQIGIAGTIIAIITALGGRLSFSLVGATILLASVICNGVGIYIRRDKLPSPALYNTRDVIENAANEPRIASLLVEAWNEYSLDVGFEAGVKARWIRWGAVLLLIGLLALLTTTALHPNPSVWYNAP